MLLCLRDIESCLCVLILILCLARFGYFICVFLFLSLRWAALYARERSRANPHTHGEAHLMKSYRPRDVSDTETVLSLILNARRPRLRRGLLQQHRIVPRVSKTPSALGGGSVPSMVFPSHRYRGTPCQRFAGVWRSYLPPQSFLPVGIGEATLLIFWLAMPATSHAGVALCVLPGDASGVSCWRRLGHHLYLGIDFDLGLGRRLRTTKSSRVCPRHPRGASCMADRTFCHST